jgi:Xaa-Pro aminopeptidase
MMYEILQQELERSNVKALVVLANSSRDPDLAGFVGPVHLGSSLLVAPTGSDPRLGYFTPMERDGAAATGLDVLTPEDLDIARWTSEGASEAKMLAEVVGRALQLSGVAPGSVALAGHVGVGTALEVVRLLEAEGWSFVAGQQMVRRWRRRKSLRHISLIKSSAAGAAAALRSVSEMLHSSTERGAELTLDGSPLTVGRVRNEVGRVMAEYGLEQPEGNIVAPAEEAAVPHNTGNDGRTLYAGQALIVDVFPKGHLFSDCTRTFCVGTPSDTLARAHAKTLEAIEAAEAKAMPGVTGWELQEAVCEVYQEAGYPTPISDPGTTRGYVHGLGHGVGFDVHELPIFRKEAGYDGVLAESDVITLEPGLYYPEAGWGLRIEDLYVVTETGVERITNLPRVLDPAAWQEGAPVGRMRRGR